VQVSLADISIKTIVPSCAGEAVFALLAEIEAGESRLHWDSSELQKAKTAGSGKLVGATSHYVFSLEG
jgi:hypothetical protein